MKFSRHLAIISVMGLLSNVSMAAVQCSDLFDTLKTPRKVIVKAEATLEQASWSKYKSAEALPSERPTLDILSHIYENKSISHVISYEQAVDFLRNEDLPLYGEMLNKLAKNLEAKNVTTNEDFEAALSKVLSADHYTKDLIEKKIKNLRAKKKNWASILGDLDLKETHELFYGADATHISPTSLIGQYIAETGAQTRLVKFPVEQGSAVLGPEKLVVAVSEASFEHIKKSILGNRHYMTVVGHANVIHDGKFYKFDGEVSDIRAPGQGTPIPMLLLKTTETQRLSRYMGLAASPKYKGWQVWTHTKLKVPWLIENYCAKGAYSCCTHWLGNIPLGDKLVDKYSFPGDRNKSVESTQPLKAYEITEDVKDLERVWKSPGHQQLAGVIGQMKANVAGNMASPGYVIQTLIGPTTSKRVPVIFWMTGDHQAAIPENPALNYEHPY